MKKTRKGILSLLLASVLCLGLAGCGTGTDDVLLNNGDNAPLPATVSLKTGLITTDSWGYTGSSQVQVAAPDKTEILMQEHTLLADARQVVVSGVSLTRVTFSSDRTTLPVAAQASAPANLLCYVNMALGLARKAYPAVSVTVEAGTPGETLTMYNYDPATGKWVSVQTAVVSSTGKVSFPVSQLSLWGIFR